MMNEAHVLRFAEPWPQLRERVATSIAKERAMKNQMTPTSVTRPAARRATTEEATLLLAQSLTEIPDGTGFFLRDGVQGTAGGNGTAPDGTVRGGTVYGELDKVGELSVLTVQTDTKAEATALTREFTRLRHAYREQRNKPEVSVPALMEPSRQAGKGWTVTARMVDHLEAASVAVHVVEWRRTYEKSAEQNKKGKTGSSRTES